MANNPTDPHVARNNKKRGRPPGSLNKATLEKRMKTNVHPTPVSAEQGHRSSDLDISQSSQDGQSAPDSFAAPDDESANGRATEPISILGSEQPTPSETASNVKVAKTDYLQDALDYLQRRSDNLQATVDGMWEAKGRETIGQNTTYTLDQFKTTYQEVVELEVGLNFLRRIMTLCHLHSGTEQGHPSDIGETGPASSQSQDINAGKEEELSTFARQLLDTVADVTGKAEQDVGQDGGSPGLVQTPDVSADEQGEASLQEDGLNDAEVDDEVPVHRHGDGGEKHRRAGVIENLYTTRSWEL